MKGLALSIIDDDVFMICISLSCSSGIVVSSHIMIEWKKCIAMAL